MKDIEDFIRNMTFEYFGSGKHKISPEKLLTTDDAVFLDVRAVPEVETLCFDLKHHVETLHIPTNEVPDRIDEIPRNRVVGVFCSAGTRAAVVHAYLCSKGYDNVYMLLGGYEELVSHLMPGKLLNRIQSNQTNTEG